MLGRLPEATLFPYTTLFRSNPEDAATAEYDPGAASPRWDGRGHFFAAAAEAMRRILVESARRKKAEKRSEEHTSELQSRLHLVCRLLLEKKKMRRALPHDCV